MKDKEKQIEEITQKAVRKNENKEGAFADLLNQEIEELKKAKAIEEMAKIIDDRLLEARNWIGSMNKGEGYWIAQELVKHYQPKLSEDSVVLSTKDLKQMLTARRKCVDNAVIAIRKKMAREILQELHDILWDEKVPAVCTLINIDIKLRELAEQYRIEVK